MADSDNIPDFSEAISDTTAIATRNWYNFWKRLGDNIASLRAGAMHDAQVLSITTFSISAISKSNPCIMTIPGHTMIAGDFFFCKGVSGMTEVNFRWFNVALVSGDLVQVNNAGASAGVLVNLGALNSTGFGTYTTGGTIYPQSTRGVFTWPADIQDAKIRLWGSGGAGGCSIWSQYGGGGGSGAYVEGRLSRPVTGTSSYVIDRGMPGIQASVLNNLNMFSGLTAFGTWTLTTPGPPPQYTGLILAHGAGVGQSAFGTSTGGDGGTPGIGAGTEVYLYQPGGQGGASPSAIDIGGGTFINASFPPGATGAGGGGMGGNNGQDGLYPGGGGAPGYNLAAVDPAFDCTASACTLTGGREIGQSGAGGAGQIVVEW